MADTVNALVLELLDWIGPRPRPYAEVMEAWRTSCPRLPVWEEANDRGFVVRSHEPGHEAQVSVSDLGREVLEAHRRSRGAARQGTAGEAPTNPEAVVQRQLDAYNARDLGNFLAEYSEDVRVYRPPAVEPAIAGKAAFGEFYATQRFNHAGLHAELLDRMVVGHRVIDHERIAGVREKPFEVAVVYEVAGGLIACMWSYAAE